MAILSGALTARKFRVVGDIGTNWRTKVQEGLEAYAFNERAKASAERGDTSSGKAEIEGWVQVHNLLDVEFDDPTRFVYTNFVVFALRVDKKSLPAKLLAAHVAKRCENWCKEQGVERCPSAVKKQIKEALEADWLARALPRVAITECCWNVTEEWLLLHSLSESTADRFRKRFLRAFGLKLVPFSPLDWLADADDREHLLGTAPSVFVEAAK